MTSQPPISSRRRAELLDAAYGYALDHGLAGVSLRPLAAAIGSSPRVLLYLFGSKDQLIRDVLARARHEQITQLTAALTATSGSAPDPFDHAVTRLWEWLSAPEQRNLARLTYEGFLRSVGRDPGPWAGFAAESAHDWQQLLIQAQPGIAADLAEVRATRALALIRGLVLELLAGAEPDRVHAAMSDAADRPTRTAPRTLSS